jgi:hypothetical protein
MYLTTIILALLTFSTSWALSDKSPASFQRRALSERGFFSGKGECSSYPPTPSIPEVNIDIAPMVILSSGAAPPYYPQIEPPETIPPVPSPEPPWSSAPGSETDRIIQYRSWHSEPNQYGEMYGYVQFQANTPTPPRISVTATSTSTNPLVSSINLINRDSRTMTDTGSNGQFGQIVTLVVKHTAQNLEMKLIINWCKHLSFILARKLIRR